MLLLLLNMAVLLPTAANQLRCCSSLRCAWRDREHHTHFGKWNPATMCQPSLLQAHTNWCSLLCCCCRCRWCYRCCWEVNNHITPALDEGADQLAGSLHLLPQVLLPLLLSQQRPSNTACCCCCCCRPANRCLGRRCWPRHEDRVTTSLEAVVLLDNKHALPACMLCLFAARQGEARLRATNASMP